MDGLALLCNLFADGPVTLKRLRLARVANLAELERTPPERLAEWLHASLPQARDFVEEARRLLRRLAEEAAPGSMMASMMTPTRMLAATQAAPTQEAAVAPVVSGSSRAVTESARLRPGLLPGLDEVVCARLLRQNVATVQALSERAGLDLARRTGIPYSSLLALARAARRLQTETRGGDPRPARPNATALAEVELRPFLERPRRAPAESELTRTDEFTLPAVEPESAGPFG